LLKHGSFEHALIGKLPVFEEEKVLPISNTPIEQDFVAYLLRFILQWNCSKINERFSTCLEIHR
jgi:hypothetical protein